MTTMKNEHELIEEFEAAFYSLENAIESLIRTYQETPMPIWTLHSTRDPGQWLELALRDIWYKDGQPGNESTPYIGVVGMTARHQQGAHEVNDAKYVLYLAGQALKQRAPVRFRAARDSLGRGRHQAQPLLNDAGLARLHIKQAWRRLPIADELLRRVHFSWYTSGRTIKRITVEEADKALCRFDTSAAHIQIQRQRLASIPGNEVLAQVYPQNSVVRANLTYFDPLPTLKIHKAMSVAMPLFVLLDRDGRLPEQNIPDPHPPPERQWPKRRDTKLEDDVFLPSIHVHRYMEPAF